MGAQRRDPVRDAAATVGTSPYRERVPTPLPDPSLETDRFLDESQRAVVELPDFTTAAVIGAPGTGKTTTLVEVMADRVLGRGWSPDEVLAVTFSRATATALRDRLGIRLGRATSGPLARTVNSLAFEIVRDASAAAGAPAPQLISAAEQDADIADLLEGEGPAASARWPNSLSRQVRATRRFRGELRELLALCTEHAIDPDALAELAVSHDRIEWAAAAEFMREYLAVASFTRRGRFDSAELTMFAAHAITEHSASERIDGLRLVLVDDLQEAPRSSLAVLSALAGRGIPIIAFGDPDVAATAFRGGEPDALGRLAAVLGLGTGIVGGSSAARRPTSTFNPVRTMVLSRSHRQPAALRAFTASITARIGTAAAGTQRAADAGLGAPGRPEVGGDSHGPALDPVPAPIQRIEASSAARQWAAVARVLRQQHLSGGIAWDRFAVVVRNGADAAAATRALTLADVPVLRSVHPVPLREDRAAGALLRLLQVALAASPLTAAVADDMLLGPFGGLDALGLRRLRRALRTEELAGGGIRSSSDLLVEALEAPGRLVTIEHRVARTATRLAETLAIIRDRAQPLRSDEAQITPPAAVDELLWIAWERSGLARTWGELAQNGSADHLAAAQADRALDAILALFAAAERFVERSPGAPASVFVSRLLDADVADDSLSARASADRVLVTTPSGIVGLEFDTVVIAALQEGVWPNLRVRGSLIGSADLVRAVTGVATGAVDDRRQMLSDELRLFALSASRARRRVVLACVANDDEAPSPLLALVPAGSEVIDSSRARPLSLRSTVARLRRELENPDRAGAAAASLALLAHEGVPGADPGQWHGLLEESTRAPLFEGELVPVSPSGIDKLLDSPMDWFLERVCAEPPGVLASIGTIVHWAMESADDTSAAALWAAVESRWGELVFEAPWVGERQLRIAHGFTDALAGYLADFASSGALLIAAESRFELEVGRARLSGSIDRVERSRDGSVTIVDLKTGTPITDRTTIAQHPQLGAYQLAYAEGLLDAALGTHGEHHSGGAKLLFVKEGISGRPYREALQAPLSEEGLTLFRARVEVAAALSAASHFAGRAELALHGHGNQAGQRLNRVRAVSSD